MKDWDLWDLVLIVGAGLIAVSRLVHLMRGRRDQLVAEVQQQLNLEQERRKREERRKKKEQEKQAA